MLQRIGGVVGIVQPAQLGCLRNELGDAAGVCVAQSIGIEAAFLPDQPREKVAVEIMAVCEGSDGIAGVIDEMRITDALDMAPFARGAFLLGRLRAHRTCPDHQNNHTNQPHGFW